MKNLAITVAILIFTCGSAASDVIHFKDGGSVEGIIKEENDDYIVIDIGFGTMSTRKDEIDYIEKATPEELERLKKRQLSYEIERGKWAPQGCEDIRMTHLKAMDDKNALQATRRESQQVKEEISQNEKKLSGLLDMLDRKGQELKKINPETAVGRYNQIVAEMNSLNADLNEVNNKVKTLYEKEKQLNENLARLADRYRTNYQLFKDTLSRKQLDTDENKLTTNERYFFNEMANMIKAMERDFKKDVASYTREGSHIVVDALLNSSVSARLIVDTGASILLISTDVASRLGIAHEEIPGKIEIIMADNSSVEAKPITLKSVKVGDAEVKDVQAAILAKEAIGGMDGLLGMSFLSHFVIKVDSTENKLILERVL